MRGLSIGDLEYESGVRRSTIYYYVRIGLLPPAHKSSPNRAIYTDDHVDLLAEIDRLKANEGLELEAIRAKVKPRIAAVAANGVDMVAQQAEQVRTAILRVAGREFAQHGYRQTRITDILAELGITAQVLYSHFSTKRDLFAAAYTAYLEAEVAAIEPPLADEPDLAVHLVWRMFADYGLKSMNPDLLYLARETVDDEPDTTLALRKAYEQMLSGVTQDFERLRTGPDSPPLSDELMVTALFGAFQMMRMRASWEERFSRSDIMWAAVACYLGMMDLYARPLEVAELQRRYEPLIKKVAAREPPVPSEFEDSTSSRKGVQ